MNNLAIRKAIFAKLAGTTAVTSLLGAPPSGMTANIYHEVAPQGTPSPFVVFSLSSGSDTYVFGNRAFRRQTWLIKAVGRADTHDTVETIDAAIDTLLLNGTLSIAGRDLMDVRRTSDVSYLETDDGEQIRHAGGLYRLTVQ